MPPAKTKGSGKSPSPPKQPRGFVDGVKPMWRNDWDTVCAARQPFTFARPGPASYLGKSFEIEGELPPGALNDLELAGCSVQGSHVLARNEGSPGSAAWVARRPRIERLHLRDSAWYPRVSGFVLSDCLFEGLRTASKGGLFLDSCGFRRVTLRGFIGQLTIYERLSWYERPNPELDLAASDAAYDDVDWALDIRDAEFSSFSIQGIPPTKVRINPEIHGILPREHADHERMMDVPDVEYTNFPNDARDLARSRYSSTILMAHRRSSSFKRDMRALASLRRAKMVV